MATHEIKCKFMVLEHQNLNDVLNDILNRLEVIEKEIGIKPMDNTFAAAVENIKEAVGNLGISAEEASRALQTTMQRLYNNLGCNAIVESNYLQLLNDIHPRPLDYYEVTPNEKFEFTINDEIQIGRGWLDEDDFNE